jgi:hypothetical protein
MMARDCREVTAFGASKPGWDHIIVKIAVRKKKLLL